MKTRPIGTNYETLVGRYKWAKIDQKGHLTKNISLFHYINTK